MSQEKITTSHFSPDVQDMILLLQEYHVRYVIVGGEAVIYYGHIRLTGDIDFFYDCEKNNADNLFQVLQQFWDGNIPGILQAQELEEKGLILQFGRPPHRIDLINHIEGVTFEEAWSTRKTISMLFNHNDIPVFFISLEKLVQNKAAAGRPKDLEDLKYLRECLNKMKGK